ncbi:hypothetical protein B224_1402 [Aeromonas media WS]|nr:hypothetical protein B224_1402 [Aeromonas media WS]
MANIQHATTHSQPKLTTRLTPLSEHMVELDVSSINIELLAFGSCS